MVGAFRSLGGRPLVAASCRAQRPERRPELGREELGLLPRREVTTPVGLIEVDEVWVGLLGPAARGPPDLAREGGEAGRERGLRRRLAGRHSCGSSVLPV